MHKECNIIKRYVRNPLLCEDASSNARKRGLVHMLFKENIGCNIAILIICIF